MVHVFFEERHWVRRCRGAFKQDHRMYAADLCMYGADLSHAKTGSLYVWGGSLCAYVSTSEYIPFHS